MMNHNIGHWQEDVVGLPCFQYTGAIPYSAKLPDGTQAKLPQDPWFLLGNYQLTLFTHISGAYKLITGQRSWGCMNLAEHGGMTNRSVLEMLLGGAVKKTVPLTGMDSPMVNPPACGRTFGCGFAHYSYQTDGVKIERNLSVKPSVTPKDGIPAFLLTVTLYNQNNQAVELAYTETITANYSELQFQALPVEKRPVSYEYTSFSDMDCHVIGVHIAGTSHDPLLFPTQETMSRVEGFPPALFMQAVSDDVELGESEREFFARSIISLQPGETKSIQLIIGYTFDTTPSFLRKVMTELSAELPLNDAPASVYADSWNAVLPKFSSETDAVLGREMRWHAYNLEAMATYSSFYDETKIPQGTIYDYFMGVHASARDNFQHALPLVYYNPALARSVLRYMLKRTTLTGEIKLTEIGNGFAENGNLFTSDQQLFFFLLLSEYLRVTKDYAFLTETVESFPLRGQTPVTVIEKAEQCFLYLRDIVGRGAHGLVRLLNSDWNDAVYCMEKAPYNIVFYTGESHMNSAMAISIFQTLIPEFKNAVNTHALEPVVEQIRRLCRSMEIYRGDVLNAFMADLGERAFPRRMYFDGRSYGDDNMFLEPQGYTLMINELPLERKKTLYQEMQKRLYAGEVLGARQQQAPEFDDPDQEKGSRENGGFWWALNGPVVMGVARFDRAEAMRLLRRMTMEHLSQAFPDYWSAYWSSADNLESSLMPGEGLTDQTALYPNYPVYCAHPHAWLLYCYYYIKEKGSPAI